MPTATMIRADLYPFEGKMALYAHAAEKNNPIHTEYDHEMVKRSKARADAIIAKYRAQPLFLIL